MLGFFWPHWHHIGLRLGHLAAILESVLAFVSNLGMSLSLNSGPCKALGCAANNLLLFVASCCFFLFFFSGMLQLGYAGLISSSCGGHGACAILMMESAGTAQGVGRWARVGTIVGLSWFILGHFWLGMLGQHWHHLELLMSNLKAILWFALAFVGQELGPYRLYFGPH